MTRLIGHEKLVQTLVSVYGGQASKMIEDEIRWNVQFQIEFPNHHVLFVDVWEGVGTERRLKDRTVIETGETLPALHEKMRAREGANWFGIYRRIGGRVAFFQAIDPAS